MLRDLYRASEDNRRFLHARFFSGSSELEGYRKRIIEAVAPDPFGDLPPQPRVALKMVRHFFSATDDPASTCDLALSALEAAVAQTRDIGNESESYFTGLIRIAEYLVRLCEELPSGTRELIHKRFGSLAKEAGSIGWGFGDGIVFLHRSLQQPSGKRS